ncbi:hypothetical protein AVEN_168016-1 [Araneus ventricosus]|uniref:Uncharacterized protein n=1 Tax=Araneus ventricosus TaxID=182803 RepID=A0A4Y2T2Q1_ARAVE|nr:hypothetical protein AVEN_168016-1 [Araneus ventricosus]
MRTVTSRIHQLCIHSRRLGPQPAGGRCQAAQEVPPSQGQEPDGPEPALHRGRGALRPSPLPTASLPLPEDPGLPVRQEDPHRHLHSPEIQAEAREVQAL